MLDETTQSRYHQPGLDGIRGLAAICVFIANMRHLMPMEGKLWALDLSIFVETGIGVLVLFLLSGYLLSLSFWRETKNWRVTQTPRRYYVRRIAKIYPAYLICLVALVVHNRHWEKPSERLDTLLHLLALHNFSDFSFYGISKPFWTIPIQIQFYLILPWLCSFCLRFGRSKAGAFRTLLTLMFACYAAHCAIMVTVDQVSFWPLDRLELAQHGLVLSKSTLAHLPIFVLGMAGGYIKISVLKSPRGGNVRRVGFQNHQTTLFWLATTGLTMLACTPLGDMLALPYSRYGFPLMPLLAMFVILFHEKSGLMALLTVWPLRALGWISYGIYVFHLPSLKLAMQLLGTTESSMEPWRVGCVGFAITIGVSAACFVLIERSIERCLNRRFGATRVKCANTTK